MVRIKQTYTPRKRRGAVKMRPIRFAIIVILACLAGYFSHRQFIRYTLGKANHALADLHDDDAKKFFARASSIPFSYSVGDDGLGALALLEGDESLANQYFQRVLTSRPSGFGAKPELVLGRFIEQGLYHRGQVYRDFLLNWKTQDQLRVHFLDFATMALGTRELAEVRRMLSNVSPLQRNTAAFTALKAMADRFEQSGEVPVVLDRNERPIVVVDIENSEHIYTVPRLFSGWPTVGDKPGELLGGLETRDKLNRIVTTLDLDVQRSAYQAMKGFAGAMVIIDPESGDIYAAYGSEGIEPFTTMFEPGSVVKLITYGFFLQDGGRVENYVPKRYPSSESISGRIFYDWTEHGRIETIEEGMAVSCNLIFAHMGIDMGWPKLRSGMRHFFDGDSKPFFFTPAKYGVLATDPEDEFQVGRAAIGLDHIKATALGLSIIPATIANQGVMPNPRLIDRVITLRGSAYRESAAIKGRKVIGAEISKLISQSMVAALNDERGTARNVEAGSIKLAAKTGTAGDRPYDAIMVGYMPLSKPRLAFAFVLKGGGKAEINGAKVTSELIRQLAVQAPAYLE